MGLPWARHADAEMPSPQYATLKSQEWQRPLLRVVSGLLVFETLSGLAIYLLPFSVSTQMTVLVHTAAGIVFVLPYLWYQLRHWRIYRSIRVSHVVLTGYFSMLTSVALVVSGLVLTAQALFGTRISPRWDLVHVIATFGLVASVVPHVVTLLLRARRTTGSAGSDALRASMRGFALVTWCVTAALAVMVAAAAGAYRPPTLVNALPHDYSYVYGPKRPFAPSLATTASGGAYDARSLGGSAACGRCHKQIYDEWQVSAHRYAAMDPAFQKVQTVMAEQNGSESTRYCGGCHDPVSLFSGTKNIFVKDLTGQVGYREGVSCVVVPRDQEDRREGERGIRDHAARALRVRAGQRRREADGERLSHPRVSAEARRVAGAQAVQEPAVLRGVPQAVHRRGDQSRRVGAAAEPVRQLAEEPLEPSGRRAAERSSVASATCRSRAPTIRAPATLPTTIARRTTGSTAATASSARTSSSRSRSKLVGAKEHVAAHGEWLRGEIDVPEIADKWRKRAGGADRAERAGFGDRRTSRGAARGPHEQQARP